MPVGVSVRKQVVMFSGGKDSTALLFKMLEKGMHIDMVVNVDTTKEFPEMYEHIELVKQKCPIPITTVKIDFDYWFKEHVKTKGKRKGDKGYGWPDFRNRWCTALKREACSFAVAGQEYDPRRRGIAADEFHGIAADEFHRKKDREGVFYPLVDWGMTEADCLEYCYSLGFSWGGLYEKRQRVSCYCCPLQRIGELQQIYTDHPELWQTMLDMDKYSFRKFKDRYTLDQLTSRFSKTQGVLI